MTIIDDTLSIASSTAGPTGTTTTKVGSHIDLGTTGKNIGAGSPGIYIVIKVATAIETAVGSGTATFIVRTGDNSDMTTSPTQVLHSGNLVTTQGATTLTAGVTILKARLPSMTYGRYLGLVQVNSATVSGGAVTAYLTLDADDWKAYPDALTTITG